MSQLKWIPLGLIATSLWIASDASARETQQTVTAETLAQWLGEANVLSGIDFETTFEVRALKPRPAEQQASWSLEHYDLLEIFRYVLSSNQMRIERRDISNPNDTDAYSQINIWSDGTWIHRVEGDTGVTLSGQLVPTDLWGHGLIFNSLEGRFPSFRTLADLVRTGRPLNQMIEDDVLTYRFARDDVPSGLTQYVFRCQLQPDFKLLSYATEIFSTLDESGVGEELIVSQKYVIDEWREFGGRAIPENAHIEGWGANNPNPTGPAPFRSRVLFTRTSFSQYDAVEVDPTLFTMPMPFGTKIQDNRLNMSFEIGDAYLYLDGVMYQLDEPLMEHPGEGLGELLRAASAMTPPATPLNPTMNGSPMAALIDDESAGLWRRALLPTITVAALAMVGVVVVRVRKARSGVR